MLDTPPDNVQHPSDYQNIARVQNCPEITILNLLFWSFSLFVAWSFCLFICLSFCHFVLCFEENCPRYCHQSFLNEIAKEILIYFETLFLRYFLDICLDVFQILLEYFLDISQMFFQIFLGYCALQKIALSIASSPLLSVGDCREKLTRRKFIVNFVKRSP